MKKDQAVKRPSYRSVRRERNPAEPIRETFTVREMNRDTAAVLRACRKAGQVVIRSRSGEKYVISVAAESSEPSRPRPEFMERMRRHWERMQALGVTRPRPDEVERLNRIIAGEA